MSSFSIENNSEHAHVRYPTYLYPTSPGCRMSHGMSLRHDLWTRSGRTGRVHVCMSKNSAMEYLRSSIVKFPLSFLLCFP